MVTGRSSHGAWRVADAPRKKCVHDLAQSPSAASAHVADGARHQRGHGTQCCHLAIAAGLVERLLGRGSDITRCLEEGARS